MHLFQIITHDIMVPWKSETSFLRRCLHTHNAAWRYWLRSEAERQLPSVSNTASVCFAVSDQQPSCPDDSPYDLFPAIKTHLMFITSMVLCLRTSPSVPSINQIYSPFPLSILYHSNVLALLLTYLSLYQPSAFLSLFFPSPLDSLTFALSASLRLSIYSLHLVSAPSLFCSAPSTLRNNEGTQRRVVSKNLN